MKTLLASMVALAAGVALGLAYSWVIAPVRYTDTAPNTLRSDFKDGYRSVIAASYAATHNLERTKARLALLADADPVETLTAQAQRMLASGAPFPLVQQIAGLASDLRSGAAASAPASSSPVPALPSPTSTRKALPSPSATPSVTLTEEPTATEPAPTAIVLASATPRPSPTPIPTASKPFELVSRDEVCNPSLTAGLLQVSVLDSRRHQMPGVEINITWAGGEESFFTGLKPEIGAGYADFVMQPGLSYAVRVAHAGQPVSGLSAPSCPDTGGQTFVGGIKLVFRQP